MILLDHAFEMFLKGAILHRGGRIRDKRAKETIGFDTCIRRGLSDGSIRFLTEEQALVLQTINGLRDAAQHHLLDISENQLYMHIQSGVTLFRDLLKSIFGQELSVHLPKRVLPISTTPLMDLFTLFDSEVNEIRKLFGFSLRKKVAAEARLRPLVILDRTIKGEKGQPSNRELARVGKKLSEGTRWQDIFQGVSAIEITTDGTGPALSLRLSKKEGPPVQLVPEGTEGASVVAVKRVNELDFYNLGAKQLGEKFGVSLPKILAVIDYFDIRSNPDFYKEIKIGKSVFKRYSQKAINEINVGLQRISINEIWESRRAHAGRGNV